MYVLLLPASIIKWYHYLEGRVLVIHNQLAYLSVHVGTIEVDLATMGMHKVAHILDVVLKHTKR